MPTRFAHRLHRMISSALLTLTLALSLSLALACASDTSPGEERDNPPPPPSRTPTGLRHAPNTGVFPMSNELSEEEAAKLGKPAEGDAESQQDDDPEEEQSNEPGAEESE